MEVFSTRFADDTREGFVAVDVSPNVLPKFLEDKCGSCKVEGGKVGVSEDVLDGLCRWAWYELNDVGRETGFEQDLVDEVVGIGGSRRGFPYDDVANKGGCTREVASDSGKVEWRNGKDEAFQRAVLYAATNEFCEQASINARKTYFHDPGAFLGGCCAYNSSTNLTPKRKKSASSAAASISACQAFLPWPSIVAAMSL